MNEEQQVMVVGPDGQPASVTPAEQEARDITELVEQPAAGFGNQDREGDLDPSVEVALHPVGRRQPELGVAGVLEIERPMVFEKPTDHRAYADVLG